MCVALIGGMDRLEREYQSEAEKLGVKLRVFTKAKSGLPSRVKNVDAVVVFTGKTSHRIKKEAVNTAKAGCIPVVMCHACGVCSLRECLSKLIARPAAPLPSAC